MFSDTVYKIIVVSKVDNKVKFVVECTEWEVDNLQAELAFNHPDCRVYVEV